MGESTKKAVMQGHNWAGDMGEKWNQHLAQFEGMLAPIGAATLALAAIKAGERVLDIGCGGAATSLELARLVGSQGHVLGLDISPALIATARQRAETAGLAQAHFECANAATVEMSSGNYDCLFSRFGVMFFDNPTAAFRNLHTMLKPSARVVFSCWGPPPENPWVGQLSELLSRHVSLPAPDPTAPGPFAFADQERTRSILTTAGFSKIQFTAWRGAQLLGGPGLNADQAADFALKAFFVGEAIANESAAVQNAVIQDVKALFRNHETANGISLDAMAWLVSAQA